MRKACFVASLLAMTSGATTSSGLVTRMDAVPLPKGDGRRILEALCFEAPDPCHVDGNACAIPPDDNGDEIRIVVWELLSPASREKVWQALAPRDGRRGARRRMRAIDRMQAEMRWHERQHAAHLEAYYAAFARAPSDPARLERRFDACVKRFHRRETRDTSYATLVGQCACYGGAVCRERLPPFPRDFTCEFGPRG